MARRPHLLLLAGALGLLTPTVVASTPAGAVDQDLVVSAASGAPGDTVEVSSASCVSEGDGDAIETLRILSARLVVGAAPDEQVAAIGSSFDEVPATLTLPDWMDPDAPAVIEASCQELGFVDDSSEFTETTTDFDPVAFDVLPGAGPSVQQRTFSRTSLRAGQAFRVTAEGCTLPDASHIGVEVVRGDDLALRDPAELVAVGGDVLGDDPQIIDVALSGGGYSISVSQTGDDPPVLESVEEETVEIPPGTYSAFTYCGADDGSLLLFQPQRIEVTGTSPTGDIDLVVAEQSRTATLAGGSCDQDEVRSQTEFESIDSFLDFSLAGGAPAAPALGGRSLAADAIASSGGARAFGDDGSLQTRSVRRALFGDDYLDVTSTPDGDGSWTTSASAPFDQGVASAYAECGDALGDGFVYDPQVALVQVAAEETTTTTSTTTTTAPTPPPANAVAGTPTYAG